MPRSRQNGGIIGPASSSNTSVAGGMWSLSDIFNKTTANNWPIALFGDFTISPAVGGVSNWVFATNGALNISTYGEYTITMIRTVTVSTKMWGAGGGPGGAFASGFPPTTNIGAGGGGGFAGGTFQLTNGQTYKLRVGQGGARTNSNTTANTAATYLKGGAQGTWSSEGGGYTGIFLTSATQGNAILMAGGGGGGPDTNYSAYAGAGGGTNGQDTAAVGIQGGGGGTQSAGGSASAYNNATTGFALAGGIASNNQGSGSLGGGGGGYWGGGGGNVGGGGGGSGFASGSVSTPTLTTGSNSTPGNSSDSARSGSGAGGTGSTAGTDGRAILTFVSAP